MDGKKQRRERLYRHLRLDPDESVRRGARSYERLRERRSIRAFSRDPVPAEAIELAIRAAGCAPSGANQQPWRFVVIADSELKRRVREEVEAVEREFYARRVGEEWARALEPLGTGWQKPYLEDAPVLIAVFALAYGLDEPGRRSKHYYVKESVGLACGFLLAALHEMGLCALTHTPSPMGFLSKLLERPANERPFLLIPVGYPAEGATVPEIERKALDEIMVWRR